MKETQTAQTNKKLKTGIIAVLLALLFIIILRRAWISDDAYITFRTVDNFLNGYGLTWNVDERVQAYTHPLWMFLVSFFSFFTREIYFTVIALSLLLSFSAVVLIPAVLSKSLIGSILAILILLLANGFVDYTTSGLENPLSFLLGGIFLARYFKYRGNHTNLLILSLIASLAALNRLDSLVIFIPPLVYAFWQTKRRGRALIYLALGQLPLILWELFSIIYYGFPFPNTYYAKLGHMLPANELLVQGLRYLQESLMNDPLTLVTILLVVSAAVWLAVTRKGWESLAVAVGVVIYIAAIVRTGGDFMSGRFFALPFFMMIVILSRMDFGKLRPWLKIGMFTLPVVLGLLAMPPTYDTSHIEFTLWHGITNERAAYFDANGLINQSSEKNVPHHTWVDIGKANKVQAQISGTKYVGVIKVIGMIGYFSGPEAHIVDPYGLGDALIARLPAFYDPNWRIGHHRRVVPVGYEESLRTGENLLADEQLALFYDRLALIIRGELFTTKRFKAIMAMNLGRYKSLIDTERYLEPLQLNFFLSELPQVEVGAVQDVSLNPGGGQMVVINLEFVSHDGAVEIGLDARDECHIWITDNENILYKTRVGVSEGEGMQPRVLLMPEQSADQGYDIIKLMQASGDATCVPGWIKLLE